jgi:hypothetical protein
MVITSFAGVGKILRTPEKDAQAHGRMIPAASRSHRFLTVGKPWTPVCIVFKQAWNIYNKELPKSS